ncbi:S66 peptidase family protein [Rubrolithibacter danxiaensis]|uniref:S66 peptidase family protein n=1 Tax=Rubrolithibacter danxiaensis TaxID=3390805 RepID=UPI003BF80BF5
MITPPFLKPGDKIAITCPAKKLPGEINDAVALLESWGLEVVLGETVTASYHQYAGSDELRTSDLQKFLDDTSIKAIIAARGGYGTIRIIDRLDFTTFEQHPKWIIGFSDITVLHSHIHANFNICTIHGQMPVAIPDATKLSLNSLRKALFGEDVSMQFNSTSNNVPGEAKGIIIGGNLTLLVMLTGSISEMDFQDKILFIEDVGEYLYSIDRMMWNLKRSGKLSGLKGLIAGGLTSMQDNEIPFGKTAEEIILEHVLEYNYPVCFNFPAGHLSDNHSLILGKTVHLKVEEKNTQLIYTD